MAALNVDAQQSQLGAPATAKPPPIRVPGKPVADDVAAKPPPIRVPGTTNVGLASTRYGERAGKFLTMPPETGKTDIQKVKAYYRKAIAPMQTCITPPP